MRFRASGIAQSPKLPPAWLRERRGLCVPTCHPCARFLELSKSQNDMTSDNQLRAEGSGPCAGRTDRRSQSDTAINVSARVRPSPSSL
ncbi:Synaptotagmin-like protein 3 [Galemys pyrenaicus]|uniref:Synaptotagmin-like protein 3 n=1 Tax=Galemys pyrenaicus TaxID=202257 RepID=A0A8J6DVK7_GALPY|nr:Synaptotagmin-like protein 3 [Galemys pyrenaicus]